MDAYDYGLPEEAIAQEPVEPRSAARLLVSPRLTRDGRPGHLTMDALPSLLREGDVVVVNETRVLPARLHLVKASGGEAEVLLLEPRDPAGGTWEALVRPGRRLRPGTALFERPDLSSRSGGPGPVPGDGARPVLEVGERLDGDGDGDGDGGRRSVRLLDPSVVDRAGSMPLPPYIHRPLPDPERYQTVFAAERPAGERSAAAPTAGLHFTPELLARCRRTGATVATVDLAIGLDTFRPVTAATPSGHVIHTERYSVPEETIAACSGARRVIAIGTTAVRALESVAATGRREGRTDLYIHGPYPFRVVDLLVTNFHLPRSSLLLLVESFGGPEWRELYATALAERYRFLSFGDAMVTARLGPKLPPAW